jgi:hypothetical protein
LVALALLGGCASPAAPTRLTGIVRGMGVVQEEPRETPQMSFYLDGVRGRAPILVTGPAWSYCPNGARATVEGRYLPPGELIRTPMLDGARIVRCR